MATKKTITQVLSDIQSKLIAPKGQTNKFGGYKYRSCEDILEGLKTLISDYGVSVTLEDDIVMVGNRIYVKATATLSYDNETKSATAFAREPESQKGMSEPQLTGSASSYARKYALNGLFAIDDTKDHDTMDNSSGGNSGLITDKQHQELRVLLQSKELDYQTVCANWNMKSLSELMQGTIPKFKDWAVSQ